ncbi:hypothetical protein SFUMM280S_00005 [Streptomyces fumanus]
MAGLGNIFDRAAGCFQRPCQCGCEKRRQGLSHGSVGTKIEELVFVTLILGLPEQQYDSDDELSYELLFVAQRLHITSGGSFDRSSNDMGNGVHRPTRHQVFIGFDQSTSCRQVRSDLLRRGRHVLGVVLGRAPVPILQAQTGPHDLLVSRVRLLRCLQLKRWFDLDVDLITMLLNPILLRVQASGPILRTLLANAQPVAVLDKLVGDLLQSLGTLLPAVHHQPHGYLTRCPLATFKVCESFSCCTQPYVLTRPAAKLQLPYHRFGEEKVELGADFLNVAH